MRVCHHVHVDRLIEKTASPANENAHRPVGLFLHDGPSLLTLSPSGAATYHYESDDDLPREPASRKDSGDGQVSDGVSVEEDSDDEERRDRKKQKRVVAPIEYEEEDSD